MKFLKIAGAIILGLIVIGMFIPKDKNAEPASSEPAKTEQTANASDAKPASEATMEAPAPSEPATPAVPEKLPVGETYTIDGGTLKAGLIEKAKIGFMDDEPGLCSMIEVTNTSDKNWAINPLEFKMAYPDHTQDGADITVTEKGLGHTDLLPGDTAAGRVCFKDDGQKGEHVIIYKPLFSSEQFRWVVNIE